MAFDPKAVINLRERRELSRSETARRMGVSPQYLKDLEDGRYANPRFETVERLANVLECGIDLFRTPMMNNKAKLNGKGKRKAKQNHR